MFLLNNNDNVFYIPFYILVSPFRSLWIPNVTITQCNSTLCPVLGRMKVWVVQAFSHKYMPDSQSKLVGLEVIICLFVVNKECIWNYYNTTKWNGNYNKLLTGLWPRWRPGLSRQLHRYTIPKYLKIILV